MKKKIDRKDYGSVLIHLKKGEITGITEKNDYNCAAFIDSVDKSVNRVVVRSYKKKEGEKSDKKSSEVSESGEKTAKLTTKEEKNDSLSSGDDK